MRHVDAHTFSANATELTAALSAGDEVVVTMGSEDYQLVAKARLADDDRTPAQREQQQAAVEAAWALGQTIKAKYGPTSSADIQDWIREGRP